ncbi:glycine cleavage system protein GcvH [Dialister succinatiphilus]|uniref:glycine cleavage system protein GcvH n=1 Tax=Dialister succinatiphilus TaxID=487173 RepID=UPI00258255AA|nr:glycine cleavage system protein GcvH [uncultured Dialister sp.]
MNFPQDVKYAKTHEWLKKEGDFVLIGLTDYAQDQLGDIVFVNLPEVGDPVSRGDTFADIESVKAVSDVYSPVTGEVEEVNEELLDAPEKVNNDPYGSWFIKVKDVSDTEDLMDAKEYEEFCKTCGEE